MEPGKLIGQKIKRAREAEGLTQPELGERLGESLSKSWSRQAVFLAEKGDRSFAAEELYALAIALNRPIHYFLLPDPEDGSEINLPRRQLEGPELEDVVLGVPSDPVGLTDSVSYEVTSGPAPIDEPPITGEATVSGTGAVSASGVELSAERERNWRAWAEAMQRAADSIADDASQIRARLSHIGLQANLARGLARFGPLPGPVDIAGVEDRIAEKEQK
jgi:transcriptional regulator with XRE-family HTH domain